MGEDFLVTLVTVYGPMSLGWVGLLFCAWRLTELNIAFTRLIDRNTEAITKFTTLLEERLPRGGRK